MQRSKWKFKHDNPKLMGFSKSSAKGKVNFKKQEKNKINNLPLHLKQLVKEERKNPRVSRRKEIKIRVEINEKEMRDHSKAQ